VKHASAARSFDSDPAGANAAVSGLLMLEVELFMLAAIERASSHSEASPSSFNRQIIIGLA
jgi:hypothetical protein